jgi:hypothetical protein
MSKIAKRLAVGTMCATMVLGSTMMAFADDTTNGSSTGAGTVEGSVSKDVFKVVVPTVTDGTYDFILDPEGLIAASKNSSSSKDDYTNADFESGATLLFKNDKSNGDSYDYSSTSSAVKVTNKGTTKVDVTITAEVKDLGAVAIAADDTFADDTSASIYLAIKDGASTPNVAAVDTTTKKATLTGTMDAVDASNYEIKYDSSEQKYIYELKSGTLDSSFPTYSFALKGAANAAGDWSSLTAVTPSVEVTWSFEQHVDKNTIAGDTFARSKSNEYTITWYGDAADKTIKSIDVSVDGTTSAAVLAEDAYTLDTDSDDTGATATLTIAGAKAGIGTGAVGKTRYFIITFGDGTKSVITIKSVAA